MLDGTQIATPTGYPIVADGKKLLSKTVNTRRTNAVLTEAFGTKNIHSDAIDYSGFTTMSKNGLM